MQAQGKGNMEWAEEAGILAIWLLAEMDMVVIIDFPCLFHCICIFHMSTIFPPYIIYYKLCYQC